MANYRKSFNFRSGVQVDNDKFLVDGRGNVGVGTSAPNRSLDVYGSARVNGLLESSSLNVSLASTFQSLVSIGNSVFFNPTTGIISAISYRGDGSLLANVIAIATDGWVKNAGTLSTSFNVYQGPFTPGVLPVALGPLQVGIGSSVFLVGSNGNIGVGTTNPIPKLSVVGDGNFTGVVTAIRFNGQINAGVSTISVNSSSDALRITQTGSGNALVVEDETNPDSSSFVIDQNGYVGINTNTPSSLHKLLVHDSFIQITNTVEGTGSLKGLIIGYDASTNSNLVSSSEKSLRIVTPVNNSIVLQSDSSNTKRVGIGSTLPNNKLDVIGNTYISGNLGIGTTNPGVKLDVFGDGRFTKVITPEINSGGANYVLFEGSGIRVESDSYFESNLGIGIPNPTESLQVSGNILVTGTGIVTATTFVGTLVGVATTSLNLTDGANILAGTISDARLPNLITSNISATTGISTVNKLRSETIGVGTDSFTSDLAIIKDASVSLELISKVGSVSIGLGSEALGNNNTARIKYNPLTQVLDFDNNGSGEINFHVHKGTGEVVGTQTGGFYFKTGSASKTLMNMSWDGRVSINEDVPILTDKQYPLMVNGNIKGRGRLDLDYGINAGISTFASLYVTGISTFNSGQNFNTSSGISSFWTFNVRNFLNVTGVSSFIGIATFLGNVAIGSSTEITNSPFQIYSPTTLTRSSLGLGTSKIYYDYVGGITTGFTDPRDQVKLSGLIGSPGKKISAFGYGDYQIRTGGLNIICADSICIHPSLAVTTTGSWEGLSVNENSDMGLKYANGVNLPMIGINTLFARSIVDVGYAVTSMNSYFIPPRLTTTEIYYVSQLWNPNIAGDAGWYNHTRANTATPGGVISGAIVFDTTASQLKVGIGSTTFCGIATFTNNHTGFSAFVPPKLTTTQRDTMTTVGISSGAIIWNLSNQRLEVRDSHNSRWYGIGTVV